MRFLIRWLVSAIAVAAAVAIVPGIDITNRAWLVVAVVALLLGVINSTLGLLLKIGGIGCIVMTLGLFTLVINAAMLMLTSWIAQNWFGLGFVVHGFWPALWGSIVISIVSGLLNWFLRDES